MAIDKRDGPAPSNVQQFASQLEASKLGGQYSKPTQVVDQFLAIGDSYTAGIGSNGQDDRDPQSYDCRRYKGAYPYILLEDNGWDELNGYSPKSPLLNFGACSGATMDDLLSKQLTLGEEWRDVEYHTFGKPQLTVLTIAGNDHDFGDLINDCIARAWRPRDCDEQLRILDDKVKSEETYTKLFGVLTSIVQKGRAAKGADPPENFQTFIQGYVPLWNDDDPGCDDISWSWGASWYYGKAFLKRDMRSKMNGLVNDLNANIKKVADALNQFGVFYVEPPNDAYAKHRFCEPAPKSYHESEVGKNTWFWHWDYPIGHNDEGPETYAFDAGSPDKDNFFNVSQAALDIFIPDKEKQKSLSADNPVHNNSAAFRDYDSFITGLDEKKDVEIARLVSEATRRSFHPKETAYKEHAKKFMEVIKANRGNVDRAGTSDSKECKPGRRDNFDKCFDQCYQGLCQENAGEPGVTCTCPDAPA